MYSVVMSRPSYGGKPKYRIQVKTLSDVAALIEKDCNRKYLLGPRVLCVENLSTRERDILWYKCHAIESRIEHEKDIDKVYSLNNLRRILVKTYFSGKGFT